MDENNRPPETLAPPEEAPAKSTPPPKPVKPPIYRVVLKWNHNPLAPSLVYKGESRMMAEWWYHYYRGNPKQLKPVLEITLYRTIREGRVCKRKVYRFWTRIKHGELINHVIPED